MKLENLTNAEICDIRLAITSVIIALEDEIEDPSTTAKRREIASKSVGEWKALKSKIMKQQKGQTK